MNKKQQKRTESGFTIIEVMIVLAIAGLIMVIALIAIPQLQRSQRNNARKSIVARISTEINNYAGNNNGKVPGVDTDLTSFNDRYLGADIDISDPSEGTPMKPVWQDTITQDPSTVAVVYYKNATKCDGEGRVPGSAREFAVWTKLEGSGAVFCADNS